MSILKPWTYGPFELILHAEMHRLNGDDFDRRIALISFDNSIEISITTYLSLNPIQRNGREYKREDVDKWLRNYHTKIDFFEIELEMRDLQKEVDKSEIVWYHNIRNDQYHGGVQGVPEERVLLEMRKIALWVFSVLFDVLDIDKILGDQIAQKMEEDAKPERDAALDRAIDNQYGMSQVAGQSYYTSELLFSVDPVAYRETGATLNDDNTSIKNDEEEEE